jgi:hypothetical protein
MGKISCEIWPVLTPIDLLVQVGHFSLLVWFMRVVVHGSGC